jgi:O-acetyl-ADP-ribose deacetylase (regulator of RNase III)
MILESVSGDLFVALNQMVKDKVKAHVAHGCNAQGVMGAGFAKQVRSAWPQGFREYKIWCDTQISALGKLHVYEHHDTRTGENVVLLNMITQLFPGRYAKEELIAMAIEEVEQFVLDMKQAGRWGDEDFIMAPRIGCGLGGLKWRDVSKLFEGSCVPFKIYHM